MVVILYRLQHGCSFSKGLGKALEEGEGHDVKKAHLHTQRDPLVSGHKEKAGTQQHMQKHAGQEAQESPADICL